MAETAEEMPPSDPTGGPPSDLPPVAEPTAGFIVQLFLIPALIVSVIAMVVLLFGKIAGSQRTPADYMADLRGANEERRWMAARELASILPHDRAWQDKSDFAVELADELESKLQSDVKGEMEIQYRQYLCFALGEFNSPVGIPALRQALRSSSDESIQAAAIISLGRVADRLGGLPDAEAIPDLVAATENADPVLRKLIALSLGATNRSEAIDGLRGLLSDSDREVRYNAASAITRLGSSAGFETLREMLDLNRLRSFGLGPDQLEAVPRAGLRSLWYFLDTASDADLADLRPLIETLVRDGNSLVRTTAKELLIKLASKAGP